MHGDSGRYRGTDHCPCPVLPEYRFRLCREGNPDHSLGQDTPTLYAKGRTTTLHRDECVKTCWWRGLDLVGHLMGGGDGRTQHAAQQQRQRKQHELFHMINLPIIKDVNDMPRWHAYSRHRKITTTATLNIANTRKNNSVSIVWFCCKDVDGYGSVLTDPQAP